MVRDGDNRRALTQSMFIREASTKHTHGISYASLTWRSTTMTFRPLTPRYEMFGFPTYCVSVVRELKFKTAGFALGDGCVRVRCTTERSSRSCIHVFTFTTTRVCSSSPAAFPSSSFFRVLMWRPSHLVFVRARAEFSCVCVFVVVVVLSNCQAEVETDDGGGNGPSFRLFLLMILRKSSFSFRFFLV